MYTIDPHIVDPYTDDEHQDMYYGTISYNDGTGNSHTQKIEVRDMDIEDLKTLLKHIANALNQSGVLTKTKTSKNKTDPYDHAMGII